MVPVLLCLALTAPPPDVAAGLKAILAVGREGAGNEAAAAGWRQVVAAGPGALVPTLAAFDAASVTSANWLRSAVTAVAEAAKEPPAAAPLLAFAQDQKRNPDARRIAYELAAKSDPAGAAAFLKTCINDKSGDLRRDAIAARMADAKTPAELGDLFAAARDPDQCEALAKKLGEAGQPVDLTKHYGLVTEWYVLGPLDAPESKGFDTVYPPETAAFDPAMTVAGKDGVKAVWKRTQTENVDGTVDLNAALAKVPNAVAFLAAVIESPQGTPADVRVTASGAVKVSLNGKEIIAREAYHQGTPRDQYTGRGTLTPGRNVVLVKVCQNDQPQPWAKEWTFAARLCDETGGKLNVAQLLPGPDGKESPAPLGRLKPAAQKPAPEKK